MSIQFAIGILDRISGPANIAGRALRSLQGELKATEKAIKAVNNVATKNKIALLAPGISAQARQALGMANRQLRADQMQLNLNRQHIAERRHFFDTMHQGFSSIVTWAAGAALGIGAMSLQLIKAAGHMSDVRSITMGFLTQQMGSHEASDTMQRLEHFSVGFGVGLEEAATSYHRLVAQGFDSNWALGLMQGAEDVASVMGRDASEGLLRDIAILKQEGQIDTRHLRALSFYGVGIGDVEQQIADARNQSNPGGKQLTPHDIAEMVKHREIGGMETASAALRVIQQRYSGGPNARLGDRAVHAIDTTFGGGLRRLDARWHLFLSRLGGSEAFAPLIRTFEKIGAVLVGTGAQDFEKMIKAMGEAVEGVDWATLIKDAADAVPRLLNGLLAVVRQLDNAYKGWKVIHDLVVNHQVESPGAGTSMPTSLRAAAPGGAPAATGQHHGMQRVVDAVVHAAQGAASGLSAFGAGGAGISTGGGLINQHDMDQTARDSGRHAAASVAEGFRDEAEIHSPSRVFTRLGINMIEGLDQGMRGRIARLETMGAMLGQVSQGGLAAGGSSVSIGDVHVTVSGGGDPEEIGRVIKQHLVSLLTSAASSKGVDV